jgi:hypothetical protein
MPVTAGERVKVSISYNEYNKISFTLLQKRNWQIFQTDSIINIGTRVVSLVCFIFLFAKILCFLFVFFIINFDFVNTRTCSKFEIFVVYGLPLKIHKINNLNNFTRNKKKIGKKGKCGTNGKG